MVSPSLSVTVLGSGTSTGVPMIGCDCETCRSPDPHDKRMRPSILVTVGGQPAGRGNLLVDTTPEMRLQMLRAGIDRIETVLVTHNHADHILGMDDIRQFNYRHEMRMPIFSDEPTLAHLRMVFGYAFTETQAGGGKPKLDLEPIRPYVPFQILGVTVTPLTVYHGKLPILAYKFGESFAYVTDVSHIPNETLPHLRGLDTLILGAVRHEPHPTHFGVGQALEVIEDLNPRRAYLTHLSHHILHERDNAALPPKVRLIYDGLRLDIPARGAGSASAASPVQVSP